MKIVKQKNSLNVINHDFCSVTSTFNKHKSLFGSTVKRGLIIGSSGSGKTNALLSLLLHKNGLRFSNIYLYCKTLNQPKYQFLKTVLNPIKEISYIEFDDGKNVLIPQQARPFSIIIFDDVICDNQSIIRDYFSFGRHYYIDCFYLAQTYSAVPKQLIRDNANFIIIFPQDITNLKHIYNDHVNVDMSFEKFQTICANCWTDSYGFLVIDKDSKITNGRYRKEFDSFIIP